jgi:hypothetical protein
VLRDYNTLIFSSGENAKLTLWGDLAHIFNDEDIGKQIVITLTSIMIQSPIFKGTFLCCLFITVFCCWSTANVIHV